MFDSPTEEIIGANNQTTLTISIGVVQAPKAFKTDMVEEVILITTVYNTGANRTPRRVIRTEVDGSTQIISETGNVYGSSRTSYVCPSPP